MTGLVESALAILTGSGHRARIASDNIGNMTTPGYKARVAFRSLSAEDAAEASSPVSESRTSFAQGPLRSTGNKFDLAIQGNGLFVVASESGQIYYTRQGHFERAGDGRLRTSSGQLLQQAGGGDLVVRHDEVDVLADGTVVDGGLPIGQIALAAPQDPAKLTPISASVFVAPETEMGEATMASVRQGMLEGANVSLGDEMLSLMTATRQAEAGARLVQVYDELMGRAFTTLGQRG